MSLDGVSSPRKQSRRSLNMAQRWTRAVTNLERKLNLAGGPLKAGHVDPHRPVFSGSANAHTRKPRGWTEPWAEELRKKAAALSDISVAALEQMKKMTVEVAKIEDAQNTPASVLNKKERRLSAKEDSLNARETLLAEHEEDLKNRMDQLRSLEKSHETIKAKLVMADRAQEIESRENLFNRTMGERKASLLEKEAKALEREHALREREEQLAQSLDQLENTRMQNDERHETMMAENQRLQDLVVQLMLKNRSLSVQNQHLHEGTAAECARQLSILLKPRLESLRPLQDPVYVAKESVHTEQDDLNTSIDI